MKSNPLTLASLAALLIAIAPPATRAGTPDAANSKVHFSSIAESTNYSMALFNLPDGTGSALTNTRAFDPSLFTVDATILVELRDSDNVLVLGYPAADVWLEARDGGLSICADNPAIADFASEQRGGAEFEWCTEFSGPFYAGGHTDPAAGDQVVVMTASTGSTPVTAHLSDLQMNSADINGDLVVNLIDLGLFAADYFGAYNFRSDFVPDNQVNLGDIGRMASGMGIACP